VKPEKAHDRKRAVVVLFSRGQLVYCCTMGVMLAFLATGLGRHTDRTFSRACVRACVRSCVCAAIGCAANGTERAGGVRRYYGQLFSWLIRHQDMPWRTHPHGMGATARPPTPPTPLTPARPRTSLGDGRSLSIVCFALRVCSLDGMASLIALAGSFAGMQEILVATESSHAKKARRSGRGGAGPRWWRFCALRVWF
jgi:hypothetical protein